MKRLDAIIDWQCLFGNAAALHLCCIVIALPENCITSLRLLHRPSQPRHWQPFTPSIKLALGLWKINANGIFRRMYVTCITGLGAAACNSVRNSPTEIGVRYFTGHGSEISSQVRGQLKRLTSCNSGPRDERYGQLHGGIPTHWFEIYNDAVEVSSIALFGRTNNVHRQAFDIFSPTL